MISLIKQRVGMLLLGLFIFIGAVHADDNTGLNFDGVNDYVPFDALALSGSTGTIEFWLSLETINNSNKCLVYNGTSTSNGFGLYLSSGKISVLFGGVVQYNTTYAPTLNVLTHYALSVSTTQAIVTVNGVVVFTQNITAANTPRTPTGKLTFGQTLNNEYFDGTLDEVRIWSTARTAAEIAAKYNCKISGYNFPSGLIHYYDFSSGTPGAANGNSFVGDKFYENLNGTLTNFAQSGSSSNYVTGKVFVNNRLYVNGSVIGGNHDGSSWTNAFATLDDALITAQTQLCGTPEIWVAKGTYLPSKDLTGSSNPADSRDKTFFMASNVSIYGGFAGTETALNQRVSGNNTILSGDIGNAGDISDNSYHVLVSNGVYSILGLDGLIISDGNANGSGTVSNIQRSMGGGVVTRNNSTFVCRNVVFVNNQATTGGAIYLNSASYGGFVSEAGAAEFTQVIFTNNSATDGAGIYNYGALANFYNCVFASNAASSNGSSAYTLGNFSPSGRSYFYNSISYGNGGATEFFGANYGSFNNSVTQDATISGTGVIHSDPGFVNRQNPIGADGKWMTADDGLAVLACAVLDNGNNTNNKAPNNLDITLNARLKDINYVSGGSAVNPVIDLGPYELQTQFDTTVFRRDSIGRSHVIPYPHHIEFDSVSPLRTLVLPLGATAGYSWEQTTDGINWLPTNPAVTDSFYVIPATVSSTTQYRRNLSVCGTSFGYANIVRITVINPALGNVSGQILSRGGAGVEGVKVYAQKTVGLPGSPVTHLDSTYTVSGGIYSFQNLFYGDPNTVPVPQTQFIITPSLTRHLFSPASKITVPISTNSQNSGYNFLDTTALSISGQIFQQCDSCTDIAGNLLGAPIKAPLDSVEIYRTGFNNNVLSFVTKTGYLDQVFGRYTTTVDDPGTYTILPKFNAHAFVPDRQIVSVSFLRDTINFVDTTTHVISGYFTAGCGESIGTAVIEFSDVLPLDPQGQPRASVFRRRVTTASNGYYRVRLPARTYKATVLSFNPVITNINDPAYVNPLSLLQFFDSYPNGDTLKVRDITNRDTLINFVYHRKPVIQLLGVDDSCTNGSQSFAIMKQLQPKTFIVNLFDGPVSRGCPVKPMRNHFSDTLELSTNVQKNDLNEELRFSLQGGSADTITLNPGIPNIIYPYFKTFELRYHDAYGRSGSESQASLSKNIVVTGFKQDTATFTTVSPQIPLMVLHDPPGDLSSSFWESSTTNEMAVRFSAANSVTQGGWLEVKVGTEFSAGIGVEVPTSIWGSLRGGIDVTGKLSSENETIITTTTTTNFSTANNPEVTGASGDVFIGSALNLLYSRATVVKYDGGCNVSTEKQLVVAEKGFATKYVYTEEHIRNTILPELQEFMNNASLSQAKRDSFANQLRVWQQVLDNNDANKQRAEFSENISFVGSSGPITSSTSSSSSRSSTIGFDLEINRDIAVSLGFDIGGSGVSGGYNVAFKMEQGKSTSNTNTQVSTTGYTLDDDDNGDKFTLNIKKDPVYNTPVFELVAGTSSCPREDGTQPRDEIAVIIPHPVVSGVAANSDAVFTINLGNTSQSNETRTYRLYFEQESNPDGAIVTVGGSPAPAGSSYFTYTVPYGGSQQITITVHKGPNAVYSYEGLKFTFTDNCDGSVSKTASISAFFDNPCSAINLVQPQDNWVVAGIDNNILPIRFDGYNLAQLTSVELQYAHAGRNDWTTAATLPVVNSAAGTQVNWNVQQLSDSAYSIRLKLTCPSGTVYTERVSGLIDRRAPLVFGKPEPTDDVYSAGDQISMNFDEDIANTNLNSNRVTMRNITDGTDIPVQVSGYQNKLAIVPLNSIASLNGKTIRVIVKNIADVYGNTRTASDTFYFVVGTGQQGTGPLVNLSVTHATMAENESGTIDVTFKLPALATDSIRINYSVGGTSVYPTDYQVNYLPAGQPGYTFHSGVEGSIMIPKNSDSAVLRIDPVDNNYSDGNRTVIISLAEGGNYRVGAGNTVTGTITNDDPASIYVFTGSGNFSNSLNWQNSTVPPSELQTGDEIIINPTGGTCILNIPLTILPGGKLTVVSGKNLIVPGNLLIRN